MNKIVKKAALHVSAIWERAIGDRLTILLLDRKTIENKFVKSFFVVQNFNIALNKVDFIGAISFSWRSHQWAIASKWDEPEKIKVFIVSTVGRKAL